MTLPTSGNPISFSQIESEFGGNATNSFGGYRLGTPENIGGKVFDELDTGIPTSGTINYGSFSGKKVHVVVDCHSANENRVDARAKYDNNNIDNVGETILDSPKAVRKTNTSGSRLWVRVNKQIGSATGNVNNCALQTGSWNPGTVFTIDIGSSGAIAGAGGDGGAAGTDEASGCGASKRDGCAGGDGSSGLGIEYYGAEVINNGIISAGYGGGGGGGYRKVEREEWWQGPVYRASGGGGGGGQGLPGGAAGTGNASGTPYYVDQGVFGVDANNRVFRKMGIIATVDSISAADATRTAGTYTIGASEYSAQGSGTGATFSIVIAVNGSAAVTVSSGGGGYVVDNTITVAAAQIGGTGSALTFDVASISDLYTFTRNGTDQGQNTSGTTLTVGSGIGSKQYSIVTNDPAAGTQPDPFTDNSPIDQRFYIREDELVADSGSQNGGAGELTFGGNGGTGGENSQAHGGGGGGGGSAGTGGAGGNGNNGTNGTATVGGNGAGGVHTGSIEGENNVTGNGGTGGNPGAAIRKTSGIIFTITNNATITGATDATGVA